MGSKFIKTKRSPFPALLRQKASIQRQFSYLNCSIIDNSLRCKGVLKPNSECEEYEIKLIYRLGERPKVWVVKPKIDYHDEIHIYKKEGDLCLFHKSDIDWTKKDENLSKTFIPWISEWIIFYEIWQLTGEWKGKEYKH